MDNRIITKAENNKEITVNPGDTIRIELETTGAAGYLWHIENIDNKYLVVLSEGTKGNPEGKTGAPVTGYWSIKTLTRGYAEILMLYYRPWEGTANSLETFRIKINIQ